jgi:hypothetical protein
MTANGTVGSYTVTASVSNPPGVSPTSFALSNASGSTSTGGIIVTDTSVGQNLQTTITVRLPTASANDVTVALSSADPTKVKLGNTGQSSLQATITAGQTDAVVFVQGQATSGSVAITAQAAGYSNGTGTVTVTPSGFVLAGANGVGASFQTFQNVATPITVYSARLDSGGRFAAQQPLRNTFGSSVTIGVSSTSAGSVAPASVTFNPGDAALTVTFTAVNAGTATITAQNPAGFAAVTDGSNTVQANIANSSLVPDSVTVGQNLAATAKVTLNGTPSSNLPVSIHVDPASIGKIQLSTSPTGAGADSINVTVPGSGRVTPDFYVYGLAGSGSATFTAQATGFGSAQGTATLAPSGIVFATDFGQPPNPILTTPMQGPSTITVFSGILTGAGGSLSTVQPIKGGLSASATITNGNPAVGTLNPSTVTIAGGAASSTIQFQPTGVGVTTLTLGVPAGGFVAPSSQYNTITVTVRVPGISCSADGAQIGSNLQIQNQCSLGQPAPAGGLAVTINASGQLLAAATAAAAGQASVQVNVPAGQSSFTCYLQALGSSGTPGFAVSAPGYTTFNGTVSLTTSALVMGVAGSDLPFTTVNAPNSVTVNIYTAQLDSSNAFSQKQQLRGGLTLSNVTLTSSSTAAATVDSPVTLTGGSAAIVTVTVHSKAPGVANITISQPAGFTASTNALFSGQPASTVQVTVQ